MLKLSDVHSHRRFKKPPARRPGVEIEVTPPPIDPLLLVLNLAVVRPKGRPIGALGRVHRHQFDHELNQQEEEEELDTSTQCDLSRFEHVLAEVEQEQGVIDQTGVRTGNGRRRGWAMTRPTEVKEREVAGGVREGVGGLWPSLYLCPLVRLMGVYIALFSSNCLLQTEFLKVFGMT